MRKRIEIDNDVLKINCEKEVDKIVNKMKLVLTDSLKRRGFVVAISGGIDSSVTAALCVKAIGKDRVFALQMPERHSSENTLSISSRLAEHFKIERLHVDITPILESVGFYEKYNSAVRSVFPNYTSEWKSKIVLPGLTETSAISFYSLVAESPAGVIEKKRLPLKSYLEIVAATNFKQRIRKMMEYYHADRLHYAATGTPNRLEYDQGFFVKLGDGAGDIKPIAHLYKSQVYQIAEYLDVPEEIRKRTPTTDTYSLSQGQDEFYFSLPYDKMDICLYAKNNAIPPDSVAEYLKLPIEIIINVFKDIDKKRNTTAYLHYPPFLIEKVSEVKI